jgi:hypothetical protein
VPNSYSYNSHKSTLDAQQASGYSTPHSFAVSKALNSSNYGVDLKTPRTDFQHSLEISHFITHSLDPAANSTGNSALRIPENSILNSTSTPSSINAESNAYTYCKCTCKPSSHCSKISTPPQKSNAPHRVVKVRKRGSPPTHSARLLKSRCVICNTGFTRSSDLERHYLNIHQGLRWHCGLGCDDNHGSGWSREDKRNAHIRDRHAEFQWQ